MARDGRSGDWNGSIVQDEDIAFLRVTRRLLDEECVAVGILLEW